MKRCFILRILISLAAFNAFSEVWYVDIDNTSGTEDGTSWATAFTSTAALSVRGERWRAALVTAAAQAAQTPDNLNSAA